MSVEYPYGFRIVGPCSGERRTVNAAAAFAAYLTCDERAQVKREAYLSAFQFGTDFVEYLQLHRTPKEFAGPCFASHLWFDIDREGDLQSAWRDAAKLVIGMGDSLAIAEPEDMLIFFSGYKGLHVGLPTSLWTPQPSNLFHRVVRAFAEDIGKSLGVVIDVGVYDRVRAFRAPNSTHPKTGLHKIKLPADFWKMSVDHMVKMAAAPIAAECESTHRRSPAAAAVWERCQKRVAEQAQALRPASGSPTALNRTTIDFIRSGAAEGDRHRLLFSAAANLGEFGCPPALAYALLSETALDSGLPPKEVHRQIECGLAQKPMSLAVNAVGVSNVD